MSIDLKFRDESESKFMGGEWLNESLICCYKHCMGKHLVVGNPCDKGCQPCSMHQRSYSSWSRFISTCQTFSLMLVRNIKAFKHFPLYMHVLHLKQVMGEPHSSCWISIWEYSIDRIVKSLVMFVLLKFISLFCVNNAIG